jgi:hypothetical protein
MKPGIQKTALLTLVLFVSSAGAGFARPQFVGNLEPSNTASIERIVTGRETDLVIIDSGWVEGFQTGMACWVGSPEGINGEILLVAVRMDYAIGLITDREEGATIAAGDSVTIKTITAPR